MSKTDKTNPFWVKLRRGDLHTVEVHDHRNGVCDLKLERSVEFAPNACYLAFHYTGTNVCCCRMCHGDWGRTAAQRRRRERHRNRHATRQCDTEYESDPTLEYSTCGRDNLECPVGECGCGPAEEPAVIGSTGSTASSRLGR